MACSEWLGAWFVVVGLVLELAVVGLELGLLVVGFKSNIAVVGMALGLAVVGQPGNLWAWCWFWQVLASYCDWQPLA